jgi:hypothetical protein
MKRSIGGGGNGWDQQVNICFGNFCILIKSDFKHFRKYCLSPEFNEIGVRVGTISGFQQGPYHIQTTR